MEQIYKPKRFAEMVGVTIKTLQRWDKEGKLKAYRTPTNRRYYTQTQYEQFRSSSDRQRVVGYIRVYSEAEEYFYAIQKQMLEEYASKNDLTLSEIYEDVGSACNFDREGWNRLLKDADSGKFSRVLLLSKDRFVDVGFDWFMKQLKEHGVSVTVISDTNHSTQAEKFNNLRLCVKSLGGFTETEKALECLKTSENP